MTKRQVGNAADAALAFREDVNKSHNSDYFLNEGCFRRCYKIGGVVYKIDVCGGEANMKEFKNSIPLSMSAYGWFLPQRSIYTVYDVTVLAMPFVTGVILSDDGEIAAHKNCTTPAHLRTKTYAPGRCGWNAPRSDCHVIAATSALSIWAGLSDMHFGNFIFPFENEESAIASILQRGFKKTPKIIIDAGE